MKVAKTQADRSRAYRERKKASGEAKVNIPGGASVKQKLAELMQWHGFEQEAEAVQWLVINAHALGKDASAPLLAVARHEYTPSAKVARHLVELGAVQAAAMDLAEMSG